VIRRIFALLPGPTWARSIQAAMLVVVSLLLLILFYEWVGNTFLDSGGTVG
jgi:hypothetical protein